MKPERPATAVAGGGGGIVGDPPRPQSRGVGLFRIPGNGCFTATPPSSIRSKYCRPCCSNSIGSNSRNQLPAGK